MRLIVIGAGAHALRVGEAVGVGRYEAILFAVSDGGSACEPAGVAVVELEEALVVHPAAHIALGVGDGVRRARVHAELEAAGRTVVTVIHPTAFVFQSATLGPGTTVLPGAIIERAVVGKGVIVDCGAIISHGAVIGDYAHVGPGAVIAPRVIVGAGETVAAGTVVTTSTGKSG